MIKEFSILVNFVWSMCLGLPLLGQHPQARPFFLVAKDGSGDFTSIQQAIDAVDSLGQNQTVIFIRNGVYQEKLFIAKNRITLRGQSEKGVVIQAAIARDIWRCENPDDWGAATVNVKGSDLTFEHLTILNSFGFDLHADTVVSCANAPRGTKTVTRTGTSSLSARSPAPCA